jgi:hypothetical protein
MGRECGTYGREQKWLEGFPRELERTDLFEDQGLDEKIKLKHILKEWNGRPWA